MKLNRFNRSYIIRGQRPAIKRDLVLAGWDCIELVVAAPVTFYSPRQSVSRKLDYDTLQSIRIRFPSSTFQIIIEDGASDSGEIDDTKVNFAGSSLVQFNMNIRWPGNANRFRELSQWDGHSVGVRCQSRKFILAFCVGNDRIAGIQNHLHTGQAWLTGVKNDHSS